jgi:hypothetical protein
VHHFPIVFRTPYKQIGGLTVSVWKRNDERQTHTLHATSSAHSPSMRRSAVYSVHCSSPDCSGPWVSDVDTWGHRQSVYSVEKHRTEERVKRRLTKTAVVNNKTQPNDLRRQASLTDPQCAALRFTVVIAVPRTAADPGCVM